MDRAIGAVRTWRVFLGGFLRHRVAFTLDDEGLRSDGSTRGLLTPTAIRIVGATHTGRTGWAMGEPAEDLIPDPGEWGRVLDGLAAIPGSELRRSGLAPQSVRAWRGGRRPSRRNAATARRLAADRARAAAGLLRSRDPGCLAPGCTERLRGRQRSFCTRHATYPGSRRRMWKEEAE